MKRRIAGIITVIVLIFSVAAVSIGCDKDPDKNKATPAEYNLMGLTWADSNADDVYETSKPSGNLKLSYDKGSKDWANVAATIVNTNYNLNLYKSLNIKVKPTYTSTFSGKLLFKLEGTQGAELWVYASSYSKIAASDGTYSFSWDISDLKYDLDGTPTKIDLNEDINMLRIFVEPGTFTVAGELLFSQLSFSKDAAITANKVISGTNENKETVNSNITKPTLTTLAYSAADEIEDFDVDGEGDERTVYSFNKNWGDISGMKTHSFAAPAADGSVEVTVNKTGTEWANGAMKISGVPAKYRYAIMVVKGSAAINDKSFMLKASGANIEKTGKFVNGDLVTLQIRLAEKTADLTGFEIFAFNGDKATYSNAKFTIVSAYLTETSVLDEVIVPDNEYTEGATFDITNNWYDADDAGDWTISHADGKTTFITSRTAQSNVWAAARTNITGLTAGFTKLTVQIQGPDSGAQLSVLKVIRSDGADEEVFSFDGTLQTIEIDLTGDTSKITNVLFFFNCMDEVAGVSTSTVVIHSAVLSK